MRGAGWCTYVHCQWGMIRTEDQASVHNNTWHSRDATALNQSPSLLRNAGFPASVTEEEVFARIHCFDCWGVQAANSLIPRIFTMIRILRTNGPRRSKAQLSISGVGYTYAVISRMCTIQRITRP